MKRQGHIWHTWQTSPRMAARRLGKALSPSDNLQMRAGRANADGRLEIFGVNAQGHIWHTWQTAPSDGWAAPGESLFTADKLSPGLAHNADGRLEVFGINTEGHIWHTWQTSPEWRLGRRLGQALLAVRQPRMLAVTATPTGGSRCSGSMRRVISGTRGRPLQNAAGHGLGSSIPPSTTWPSRRGPQRRRAARGVRGQRRRATSGTPGRPLRVTAGTAPGELYSPSTTSSRSTSPATRTDGSRSSGSTRRATSGTPGRSRRATAGSGNSGLPRT